ncbi:hypothetical protein [Agrococcus jenensis]|uniref:Uncharacterized protein n=1 Tax=Agrococcus jenensis TaxID=46353 RepID=A0A3N2ARD4_9MICO|nr:hypothetical protein [Agrococcus jenensis]ROR65478.1 hypothetical protein EDD26_0844 [Agrococcus jenensis]
MGLNVVVLLTTLLVGLLGSATSVTDSVPGKVVVSTLLVVSTATSIWLRRTEHLKEEEMYAGVRELSSRALPAPASFDHAARAVSTYLRERCGLHLNAVQHKVEQGATAFIVQILFSDPAPETGLDPDDDDIEWEDYPELICGVLVLDANDVRTMSRLKGRRLEQMLEEEIIGAWGREATSESWAFIDHRMMILLEGILVSLGAPAASTSTVHDRDSHLVAIEVEIDADPTDPARVLVLDAAFLTAMLREPVLERGAMMMREVRTWLSVVGPDDA